MRAHKLNLWILIILAFALFYSATTTANESNHKTDKRALDVVLVMDSSGSMKYSDPHELRKPAAKLFLSLLGGQDRASIVSFSDEGYPVAYLTNVKGKANQKKLFSSVDKISTRGIYTNLYGALETALKVLNKKPLSERKKIIVLMSDGRMDVGNNSKAEQYTNKLMQELLPQLKANNIQVQTLAFTDGSDQELLKKIAALTNGKFKLAISDKDLHGVYTDIFEHSKQPDMIPFEGETFKIDSTIKEVTIVGSKEAESVSLSLISPSNKTFTAKDAAKDSANDIKWSESPLFDLITINKPETGEWKIKASSGENKAYVITDLNFRTSTEPQEAIIGEGVMIKSWLENNDKIITPQDLRAPLSIKLQINTPEGETHVLDMEPDAVEPGQAANGVFASYIALPTVGRHELKMVTTAPTFSRESTVYINILNPPASTQKIDPIAPPIPAITTEQPIVAKESTHQAAPGEPIQHSGEKPETAHNETMTHSNEPAQESHADVKPETEKAVPPTTKEAGLAPDKEQEAHKKDNSTHDKDTKESSGMATAIYIFIGFNLFFLIIGGVIFVIIRKKNKKSKDAKPDSDSDPEPKLDDSKIENLEEAA